MLAEAVLLQDGQYGRRIVRPRASLRYRLLEQALGNPLLILAYRCPEGGAMLSSKGTAPVLSTSPGLTVPHRRVGPPVPEGLCGCCAYR